MVPPVENPYKKKISKSTNEIPTNPRLLQDYIQTLQTQLREEHEEKEALSLERAKLKVCWEMTLEELATTKSELMEKIKNLEDELQKQMKRKRVLQNLLKEYGKNMEEMKAVIEKILIERPKSNFKY